jgi:Tol biopolymer transport system component
MERQGNITEDDAILLGAAMCDALMYLHTRKPPILHRDIKPGNVKITPDGHIFLVDFGLAKVLHGSQATTTGARAMTPGYSPPEQYGTARTDPRTDVYSLGATLYAALTGIIPEDGLARAMDNTQLTPLRKRNSKISRRLAASIEKAMGIDPADRYQTAEEFKRSLLGSKSKTQRLPGDYLIQPPPPVDDAQQSPIERESQPLSSFGKKNGVPEDVPHEEPEFKPRKRRKKWRVAPILLWLLFLLSAGVVGVARFAPAFIPPDLITYLPPILLLPTEPPATTPLITASTATTTGEILATATFTITPESPSTTSTPVPTRTLSPVVEITNTPTLGPTAVGGGQGQIAFASARSGLPQIYLINIDGTGLKLITSMENGACQPSWSPNGFQLVFISPCRERGEFFNNTYNDASLYLINADGTGLKPLTTVPGSDFDPAWSPDGKRIAFTSLRDGTKDIYVLKLESGGITRLTTVEQPVQENSQPSWSPFGNQIGYTVKRYGAYQVWVMSDTGDSRVQIARSGQQLWDYLPTWSPDGETVIFNQRNLGPGLPWLMSIRYEDRDSKKPIKLDFQPPIEDVQFSPDGLWIVFESANGDGNRDIYFSTITGGDLTRLTNDPFDEFDPAWRPVK